MANTIATASLIQKNLDKTNCANIIKANENDRRLSDVLQ